MSYWGVRMPLARSRVVIADCSWRVAVRASGDSGPGRKGFDTNSGVSLTEIRPGLPEGDLFKEDTHRWTETEFQLDRWAQQRQSNLGFRRGDDI